MRVPFEADGDGEEGLWEMGRRIVGEVVVEMVEHVLEGVVL